jgi:hypothetical protein
VNVSDGLARSENLFMPGFTTRLHHPRNMSLLAGNRGFGESAEITVVVLVSQRRIPFLFFSFLQRLKRLT